MGIRVKNLTQVIIELRKPGSAAAANDVDCGQVPFKGWISNLYASFGDPGSGVTSSKLDLNKNGTTVFAASTTQISVTPAGVQTLGVFTEDPVPVDEGDILSLDIDTEGSGSPANLSLIVNVTKIPPAKTTGVVDQNETM